MNVEWLITDMGKVTKNLKSKFLKFLLRSRFVKRRIYAINLKSIYKYVYIQHSSTLVLMLIINITTLIC